MIFFTSDTHFGHTNLATKPPISNWDSGYRDFDSTEEHDNYILDQINFRIQEKDILYHLGDFCRPGASIEEITEYRKKIKCREVHLILGNHDKAIRKMWNDGEGMFKLRSLFTSVSNYKTLKYEGVSIVLFHYPIRQWFNRHRTSIHLYGHSHGTTPPLGRSFDVGVDSIKQQMGDYMPITIIDVVNLSNQVAYDQLNAPDSGVFFVAKKSRGHLPYLDQLFNTYNEAKEFVDRQRNPVGFNIFLSVNNEIFLLANIKNNER